MVLILANSSMHCCCNRPCEIRMHAQIKVNASIVYRWPPSPNVRGAAASVGCGRAGGCGQI